MLETCKRDFQLETHERGARPRTFLWYSMAPLRHIYYGVHTAVKVTAAKVRLRRFSTVIKLF